MAPGHEKSWRRNSLRTAPYRLLGAPPAVSHPGLNGRGKCGIVDHPCTDVCCCSLFIVYYSLYESGGGCIMEKMVTEGVGFAITDLF